MGRLSKLRYLSAAHNRLAALPGDFRKLSLEKLDLFGNPFIQANPLNHSMKVTFPFTLQELSSRAVVKLRLELKLHFSARFCTDVSLSFSPSSHRIPHGPHLIPAHLCRDLEVAKTCDCGNVCVSFYIKTAVSVNLHQVSYTVVLVDDMGGTDAPVEQYFCSLSCYLEFLDNSIQRGVR